MAESQNTLQRLKARWLQGSLVFAAAGLWDMAASAVGVSRVFTWAPLPPWSLDSLGEAFQQSKGM